MMRLLNITFLDLENDEKKQFDFYLFKQLYQEVRGLKIKNLDLSGKAISTLSTRKRSDLLSALINNFHLQHFASINKYFPKAERKELEAALARNRLLDAEKVSQYDVVKRLQNNPTAENRDAVKAVIAMIEGYKDQFQQARAAMLPYANEKHLAELNRRMDVLMTHAAGWMKDNNEHKAAVRYYLDISAQSSKYLDARRAAFELTYPALYDELYDAKDAFPALAAFIYALSCCLDARGLQIGFVEDKQKIFNYYLCAAAGMTREMNAAISISPEQRNILLPYVLMRSVCLSLPSSSTGAIKLFQEKESRLKQQFYLLPKVEYIADVEKLMAAEKPSFYDVWEKTTAAVSSLQDTHLTLLFKAVAPSMNAEVKEVKLGQRYSVA